MRLKGKFTDGAAPNVPREGRAGPIEDDPVPTAKDGKARSTMNSRDIPASLPKTRNLGTLHVPDQQKYRFTLP